MTTPPIASEIVIIALSGSLKLSEPSNNSSVMPEDKTSTTITAMEVVPVIDGLSPPRITLSK